MPNTKKPGAGGAGLQCGVIQQVSSALGQVQDNLSAPIEQARIAERLSLAYQRQAREQRGVLALQAAGLARHFGMMQRAHLGSIR